MWLPLHFCHFQLQRKGIQIPSSSTLVKAYAKHKVIYLVPSTGGISDYARTKVGILRDSKVELTVFQVSETPFPLLSGWLFQRSIKTSYEIIEIELGANQRRLFWAAYFLKIRLKRPLVVTVHDPGVVIDGLFRFSFLQQGPRPFPGIENRIAQILHSLMGVRLIEHFLRGARIIFCLNKTITEIKGNVATYIPQPVYHNSCIPKRITTKPRIAYLGYWSPSKGLDALVKAYIKLIPEFPGAEFVIAGSGGGSKDTYETHIRKLASRDGAAIQLPGFIANSGLDHFLSSLSIFVLPYSADVPGGASAMLMRAQELGTPLIVSDTANLRAQTLTDGVTLVEPNNPEKLYEAIKDALINYEDYLNGAANEQQSVYLKHGWSAFREAYTAELHNKGII